MTISATGSAVLRKLSEGTRLVRDDASWRLGRLEVDKETLAELRRHDLVEVRGGSYVISSPGRALVERAEQPDAPNRRLARRRHPGVGTASKAPTVNLDESPLAWLMRRGMISERQFEAGERLRSDFLRAGLGPQVTMSWSVTPSSPHGSGLAGKGDATLGQIEARRRFEAATTAAGSGLTDVLWRVVCVGEGLEATERAFGWPARAGKVVLRLALDRLAEHYGLP